MHIVVHLKKCKKKKVGFFLKIRRVSQCGQAIGFKENHAYYEIIRAAAAKHFVH